MTVWEAGGNGSGSDPHRARTGPERGRAGGGFPRPAARRSLARASRGPAEPDGGRPGGVVGRRRRPERPAPAPTAGASAMGAANGRVVRPPAPSPAAAADRERYPSGCGHGAANWGFGRELGPPLSLVRPLSRGGLTGGGVRSKAAGKPPRRGNPGVWGRAWPSPEPFSPPLPPLRERGLGGEGGPGGPGRETRIPLSLGYFPRSGRRERRGWGVRAASAGPVARCNNHFHSDAYPCGAAGMGSH